MNILTVTIVKRDSGRYSDGNDGKYWCNIMNIGTSVVSYGFDVYRQNQNNSTKHHPRQQYEDNCFLNFFEKKWMVKQA